MFSDRIRGIRYFRTFRINRTNRKQNLPARTYEVLRLYFIPPPPSQGGSGRVLLVNAA